ncbi:MAG: alpha/beta fold hydrolase [Candidatus Dormibacteria bacterium]
MAVTNFASAGELYVRKNGSGPPVLFIHGTGADADIWGEAYDIVARSCHAIAYDRRGFSRSFPDARVDHYRTHADDAAALLGALTEEAATLVGWSSGGPIALDLALSHPDLVAGLVLVEPVSVQPATLTPGAMAMLLQGKSRQLLRGDHNAAKWFYRWATAYKHGGTGFDAMPPALREAEIANASASMREIQTAWPSARHQTRKTLNTIVKPTLVLLSDSGKNGSWYARTGRFIASAIPGAQVETIAGSCHAMFRDNPQAFADHVVEMAYSAHGRPVSTTGGRTPGNNHVNAG